MKSGILDRPVHHAVGLLAVASLALVLAPPKGESAGSVRDCGERTANYRGLAREDESAFFPSVERSPSAGAVHRPGRDHRTRRMNAAIRCGATGTAR